MARRSVADFIPGLALGLGSGACKAFPLTDPKDLLARHFPYKFTSPLGKKQKSTIYYIVSELYELLTPLFLQIKHISFILQPDLHTRCITACSLAFEERIKNFQGFQRWHALVHRRVLPGIQACLPSFQENLASQARKILRECLPQSQQNFQKCFS